MSPSGLSAEREQYQLTPPFHRDPTTPAGSPNRPSTSAPYLVITTRSLSAGLPGEVFKWDAAVRGGTSGSGDFAESGELNEEVENCCLDWRVEL